MSDPVGRYARLCVHGHWEAHPVEGASGFFKLGDCPGGSLLDAETIIIAKVDGKWPFDAVERLAAAVPDDALAAALALKENGQTVWVCEAHKAASWSGFPAERSICPVWVVLDGNVQSPCRMVKAVLHIHREGT